MFRVISIFIWLVLIITPLVWFFNNNGWINIIWLGHEVKIDILTFFIGFILALGLLLVSYRLFFFIVSIILGLFGIFKTDELKKRDKTIKKYEDTIASITNYIKSINENNIKEARSWQKKIYSFVKNDDLKEALLNQINKPKTEPDPEIESKGNKTKLIDSLTNFFKRKKKGVENPSN